MTTVEQELEDIGGKAQLSVTVPIPLYIWAKRHAQAVGTTVSGFIASLIADARAQEGATNA